MCVCCARERVGWEKMGARRTRGSIFSYRSTRAFQIPFFLFLRRFYYHTLANSTTRTPATELCALISTGTS